MSRVNVFKWVSERGSEWFVTSIAVLVAASGHHAMAAQRFIDDARRSVMLPDHVSRVFAAGAPAEVLLYTLAPEKMVGRNHLPAEEALEFMPAQLRHPVQIHNLPNAQDAQHDAELLALKPDVYIDYGDVNDDYVDSLNNVQQRTGIPALILDGDIKRLPATYRRLGSALGVRAQGERLAKDVERLLAKYDDILGKQGSAPRVYLACSADFAAPCLEGESSGDVMQWLGAINVAGTVRTAPLRPITVADVAAWNPDVVIAANAAAAARIRQDPAWQSIKAVSTQRVYAPPALPFNWGPRPPSVNRLLGMIWLAHVLPGRPFDAAFYAELHAFCKDFYHVSLSDEQMRRLVARP